MSLDTIPAIYCGTYHKYNCGSIFGKWFKLNEFADCYEFLDACRELHSDEEDPELMFQDWEGIPEALCSESWVSDKVWEYMEACENRPQDAVDYFIGENGTWDERRFDETYCGSGFGDFEDYAEQVFDDVEECPPGLRGYIDMESYARDLEQDYIFANGHVFRRY